VGSQVSWFKGSQGLEYSWFKGSQERSRLGKGVGSQVARLCASLRFRFRCGGRVLFCSVPFRSVPFCSVLCGSQVLGSSLGKKPEKVR
jgi:hypothetical protein